MCAKLARSSRGVRYYSGLSLSGVMDVASVVSGILAPGDVVFVYGDVGAGKTAFCRVIVESLSEDSFAGSPTFPVICEYKCPSYQLYHIDLYRICSLREVCELGAYDLIEGNVTLIEWPEILGDSIRCGVRVNILPCGLDTRNLEVEYL